MNKAFFLDRDGVVNYDLRYLHEPEKVKLMPGFVEGLKALHQAGYLAVVVTNQGGVALGMYQSAAVHATHARIQELLAEHGEKIDAFYFCPHHAKVCSCSCRKPGPGLLLRGAYDLDIDLGSSVMIGDRVSDLEAGRNAGCARAFLVPSFYWETHRPKALAAGFEAADSLLLAVQKVCGK